MRRRSNLLSAEIGLGIALSSVLVAFAVDTRSDSKPVRSWSMPENVPFEVIQLPPTTQQVAPQIDAIQPDLPPEVKDMEPIREDPRFSGELPVLPPAGVIGVPLAPPPIPAPDPPTSSEWIYDEHTVFEIAEVMPELIGGLRALQSAITYPPFARQAGIEGQVLLQFVVNTDGSVSDAEVVEGIGGGCDEAALEAIGHARFTPGLQRGRPVRVRFTLPVAFKLR